MDQQTVMSSKGQVVIPAAIRETLGLKPGQPFQLELTKEGVLLRPVYPDVKETSLDKVAGFLYRKNQSARSIEDMDEGIRRGVKERQGAQK